MILQLNPSLHVIVTSKNNSDGQAIGWIDYGAESDLIWIVVLDNGEVWMVPNHEIRFGKNWTLGRR